MAIDLVMSGFLSTFRIEHMRLSGKSLEDASKAAFDWIAANTDWRQVNPVQAAALSLAR